MPPDPRDWLPEGHLAWFVLASVEEMDLEAFYGSYRQDGNRAGGAPRATTPTATHNLLKLHKHHLAAQGDARIPRRAEGGGLYWMPSFELIGDEAGGVRVRRRAAS
jgi:hypothetical protein